MPSVALPARTAAPKVKCGLRKPSPAEQTDDILAELLETIRSEQWRQIRSTNLGVISGTGVVEDLLLKRLQAKVAALHLLVLKHDAAGERLGALATRMTRHEVQQVQSLLDVCGHPELCDYVRVLRYHTANPAAEGTTIGPLRRRARSTPRQAAATDSGMQAAQIKQRMVNADAASLRFVEITQPEHKLAVAAYQLLEEQRLEEEEERAAAEAAKQPRRRAPKVQPEVDDGMGWLRRQRAVWSKKMELLTRHDSSDEPPFYAVDLEPRWRNSVYNSGLLQRFDAGVVDHPTLLSGALPLYPSLAPVRAHSPQVTPQARAGMSFVSNTGLVNVAAGSPRSPVTSSAVQTPLSPKRRVAEGASP